MPFKQAIIPLLDRVDDDVTAIGGASNTVVIEAGRTTGYNTDWVGALASLEEAEVTDVQRAIINGAGGVARAIAFGLKRREVEVFIAARSIDQRTDLVHALDLDGETDLHRQGDVDTDLVANATPDASNTEGAVELSAHKRAHSLLDVVFVNRTTLLVKAAREMDW